MSSVLQQTLRGLCYDTGWCYAVFWKLKRQARTVLTWEDAYYERKVKGTSDMSVPSNRFGAFGQQAGGQLADFKDPIGVAVAQMSYHVYSVGEGIIGRVAFTNKHQWVFSPTKKETVAHGVPNKRLNPRAQLEKYPSGWEHQFAAGIKTIAVIAVPQGVVQLGATQMIAEDMKLIGHVKALFGTLQNVPGAFLSDLVAEVQKGGVHTLYPVAVPTPQLPHRDPSSVNVVSSSFARVPSPPANVSIGMGGMAAFNSTLSHSGVGIVPTLLASQLGMNCPPSLGMPAVFGVQGSMPHFQQSSLGKSGVESMSQVSFPFFRPSTWLGPVDGGSAKADMTPQIGTPGISLGTKWTSVDATISSTSTKKVERPPPRAGIISQLSLSSKASHTTVSVPTVSTSPQGSHTLYSVEAPACAGNVSQMPHANKVSHVTVPVPSTSSQAATRNAKGAPLVKQSELSKLLGQGRPVVRSKSPGRGRQVSQAGGCRLCVVSSAATAELSDITSSMVEGGRVPAVFPECSPCRSSVESKPLDWCPQHASGFDGNILPLNYSFGKGSREFACAGHRTESPCHMTERSSVESPLLGNSRVSMCCSSDIPGGLSTQVLGSNNIQGVREEFCDRESAEVEQSQKPSGVESSHQCLTVVAASQMSDLLQLAEQFESTDSLESENNSSARKGGLDHDGDSCVSLLCDDFLVDTEPLQTLFQNTEMCAGNDVLASTFQSFSSTHLDDFDEFFTSLLSRTEVAKNEAPFELEPYISDWMLDKILESPPRPQICPPIFKGEEAAANSQVQLDAAICWTPVGESKVESYPWTLPYVTQTHGQTHGGTKMGSQKVAALPASRWDQTPKRGKKRACPDDEERQPQASDRQQVQDRIQELRSLVPDGAMCSINTLLERTVHYLGILQSVSNDPGKRTESNKLQNDRGTNLVHRAECTSIEASWVVDIDGQRTGDQESNCPILVENMSQPGQKLVEMLCEGVELFLEMAQCIRRLGLTILKAVTETRDGKVWARLVVKGAQDIHRVHVLWSLMQLLGSRKAL